MPAPIIPWQPSNIPSEIQAELNRRKVNRSFSFLKNQTATWDAGGDWNTYKGPMTSWIRMCSNSAGHPQIFKPRFVLYGGKGFYETYGFSKPDSTNPSHQIIGYTPGNANGTAGLPHVIDNTLTTPTGGNFPIHVATPEISRITVTVQKELFRRANVEWVCFSWKQLEYMTPYFLIPGISIMLEWGWNHFNPTSLVPLHDIFKMRELWGNAYPLYTDNVLNSNGNYDVIYGIVSNFNWSIEGNKIVCTTEITSKDRLYAGIAKDNALIVKSNDSNADEPDPIYQSIFSWLSGKDTVKNILRIARADDVRNEIVTLTKGNAENSIWGGIFLPLLEPKNPGVYAMKAPYVRGIFCGRTKDDQEVVGKPDDYDFDKNLDSGDMNGENFWINMGLIVEILNYFSSLPGGNKKSMFDVDIMNSVISGHPNLISSDSRVLIPNYKAPKYHYGGLGKQSWRNTDSKNLSLYESQYVSPIDVPKVGSDLANLQLMRMFYQSAAGKPRSCYRNDLDMLINYIRYQHIDGLVSNYGLDSWSFPSSFNTLEALPSSPKGLNGNYIVSDYSGLLSNIYLRYDVFMNAIKDPGVKTYTDIYKYILQVLMESVDGFWDLALVEVENNMTIVDKKYVGVKQSMPDDSMCVFDYGDADSVIKSIKFHPQLSDAQATRAIFGSVNNSNSKYSISDKNDLLDYKFVDAINFNDNERRSGDLQSDLDRRSIADAKQQMQNLVGDIQKINVKGDKALQMTNAVADGQKEIFKLILPNQQLLRMLLDDGDVKNNSRYCAVQPGIILELVILGIGGIRTFQYFTIKNLPEPYSHRNIIFRVTDVVQTLESGNWETTIRAQLLPLTEYIKDRVQGPNKDGTWPKDETPNFGVFQPNPRRG